MCTLIISKQRSASWPVMLAFIRDEYISRPSLAPGRYWEDNPYIVAGQDLLGKGTWLGINDFGVFAAILDREGTLRNLQDRTSKSRGEIVLNILKCHSITNAASYLLDLNPSNYKGFNLIFGDCEKCFSANNIDSSRLSIKEVSEGLHMVTAFGLDNIKECYRTRTFFPTIIKTKLPDPTSGQWLSWLNILSIRAKSNIYSGMCIIPDIVNSFGTVSSSLIAINKMPSRNLFMHAEGIPGPTTFYENYYPFCDSTSHRRSFLFSN